MTEREAAINRDLRTLDDAHRLGRISRVEYRNRRRRVLQPAPDSDGVVTARKALVPSRAETPPRSRYSAVANTDDSPAAGRALDSLLSMRSTLSWKTVLVVFAGVILVVLVCWMLLRP